MELKPCGTVAAYHRPRRRGEATCEPCRAALRIYERESRSPESLVSKYGSRKVRQRAATQGVVLILPSATVPCRADPEAWFSEDPAGIEHAKTACRSCPVLAACQACVLANPQEHGVWGGLSPADRQSMEAAA